MRLTVCSGPVRKQILKQGNEGKLNKGTTVDSVVRLRKSNNGSSPPGRVVAGSHYCPRPTGVRGGSSHGVSE